QLDDGWLAGYRIDAYPPARIAGRADYVPPAGFVELTADNEDIFVSPHFRLGQFQCHQYANGARYLALRPELLVKLERLLEELNRAGHRYDSFVIQSGYRTPFYNTAIGNEVAYSRHLYGDAADIYVDRDGDGFIDDLNRDGRSTRADAAVLYDLVERLSQDPSFEPNRGGLGEYDPATLRGAFIHVDARGLPVRWGRVR
ncbi:MAG: D-Ala-D-Ala carboxypeptidase family metallohydrolase, partial [Caulobacterales bacterium]|nr:D-Ala-D-Ala carboxypeptidase family metallohydrolase [Caulobacterales bacterium]